MKLKTILLGSVSAIATSAVGAGAVYAAPPVPNGYTLSLEGGYAFSPGTQSVDKTYGLDKAGAIELDHDVGYYGAISLDKQVNNLWDVAIGASAWHLLPNTGTYTSSGGYGDGDYGSASSTFTSNFDFQTADLEFGYRPPQLNQDMDLRVFAGLRALHSVDSQDKTGSGKLGYDGSPEATFNFDNSLRNEFLGVGPRVGLDFSKRFDGSQVGISGLLAGAAIFGVDRLTQKESRTVTPFGDGPPDGPVSYSDSNSSNSMKTVFNLQAALGLDYYIGDDGSKVTLGLQAQELWNVRSDTFGLKTNYLEYGPFVKWVSHF